MRGQGWIHGGTLTLGKKNLRFGPRQIHIRVQHIPLINLMGFGIFFRDFGPLLAPQKKRIGGFGDKVCPNHLPPTPTKIIRLLLYPSLWCVVLQDFRAVCPGWYVVAGPAGKNAQPGARHLA